MDKIFGGILVIGLGLVLVTISFWIYSFLLIYGISLTIIGLVIVLNKNEDKIEKINYSKIKKLK